jgi:hypothetical protein
VHFVPERGRSGETAVLPDQNQLASALEAMASPLGGIARAIGERARGAAPLVFRGHADWTRTTPSQTQGRTRAQDREVDVRAPASVTGRLGRIHSIDVSDALVRRGPGVSARAQELGARGFTHGGVVHLPDAAGPLDGGDAAALLAHELTHVAQQRRFGSALPAPDSPAGRALEAEAQAVEQWYAGGHSDPPPQPFEGTVVESWSAPSWQAPSHHQLPALQLPHPAATRKPAADQHQHQPALQLAPAPWSRAEISSTLSDFASSQRERLSGMWSEAKEDFSEGYHGSSEQPQAPQPSQGWSGPTGTTGSSGGGVGQSPPPQATAEVAVPPPAQPAPTGLTAAEVADLLADDPPRRWMDMDADEDLDELALRLYDRIVTRLRFDVLVQRERSGTLLDFG